MKPAYRALSVPLISCLRLATRSSLDLLITLYTFKVSESICVPNDTLKIFAQFGKWKRGEREPHRAAESATGAGQRPHK